MKRLILIPLFSWLSYTILMIASLPTSTIHVGHFGAIPNDGIDDTVAIRTAFAVANRSGATILFENGEYQISGREPDESGNYAPIFPLNNYANLTIEGEGALLNARNWATTFDISHATNLIIRNLKIDWEEDLPFTSGEIVAKGTENNYAYVDMAVVYPHTARSGIKAGAFLQYDPVNIRPATNGYDIYNAEQFAVPCTVPANEIMRCYLSGNNNPIQAGTHAIIRHQVYNYNAFSISSSNHVAFENVTVYSAPGMGLYAQVSQNLELNGFNVLIRPNSGRWMSSSADATHFETVRGTLTVNNSLFEGMGDDAFNVHTSYLRVVNLLNAHTIQVELARSGYSFPPERHPQVGDNLQIGIYPNPLLPFINATVTSVVDNNNGTINLTVAETLPLSIGSGALVANRSGLPGVVIQNCEVSRNRARALLIRTHDVLIENCRFSDVSGPAILIEAEASYFYEGIPAEDVTIRNNIFLNNNYGAARHKGVISIVGEVDGQIVGAGTFRNILIENNTFSNYDGGTAIFIASSDAITIQKNAFSFYIPEPLNIHMNNTCNIFLESIPWCANYRASFQEETPPSQWQYLWNANSSIGNSVGYSPLIWNGEQYDSDGFPGFPDNTPMANGHLRLLGGHTGQATAQSDTDPKYAIVAYTIPVSGPYEIVQSSLIPLDTNCPLFDGFNIRIYINETLISDRLFENDAPAVFDTLLGDLTTTDKVYVAIGPNSWDDCDAFDWDFSVARVTEASGGYAKDFQANHPNIQWQYLWNDMGSIGNRLHYTPLLWNGSMYDSDGDAEYPDPDSNLMYGNLQLSGGHPGPSVSQGQSRDRYVIAAFTIAKWGEYAIKESRFTDQDTNCGEGNRIYIYVNDILRYSQTIANGNTIGFDQNLGTLNARDTIYVASGPNDNDSCDWFAWDFSIVALPIIPDFSEFIYLPVIANMVTPH